MGIKNLWQALKPYTKRGHLSHFRRQRVAVDSYVWLHRAILANQNVDFDLEVIARYLWTQYHRPEEERTPLSMEDAIIIKDTFIDHFVKNIETLQRYEIIPVCVFDGASIPMKEATNQARGEGRRRCFDQCIKCLEEAYLMYCHSHLASYPDEESRLHFIQRTLRGTAQYRSALQDLPKAVDVSPSLAHAVVQYLRHFLHVDCYVSPYEADAQISYLVREGYCSAAISEDGDLIAYYCPVVISKVDFFSGQCDIIRPPDCAPAFFAEMAGKALKKDHQNTTNSNGSNKHLNGNTGGVGGEYGGSSSPTMSSLPATNSTTSSSSSTTAVASSFRYESFLLGCVLSGCDYMENLKHIGVKSAFKLVSHASSVRQLLELIAIKYGYDREYLLGEFRTAFLSAFYCFSHHIVYCPKKRSLVHYHALPSFKNSNGTVDSTCKTGLIGERWDDDVAIAVCEECRLHPLSHKPYYTYYTTLNPPSPGAAFSHEDQYPPLLVQYLKRTRRGQTSMTAYKGFEKMSSARVVIHHKNSHNTTQGATSFFQDRAPLQKVNAISPNGNHATPSLLSKGPLGAKLGHESSNSRVTLVRSRHFLKGYVKRERNLWSDSSEEDESPFIKREKEDPKNAEEAVESVKAEVEENSVPHCDRETNSMQHSGSHPSSTVTVKPQRDILNYYGCQYQQKPFKAPRRVASTPEASVVPFRTVEVNRLSMESPPSSQKTNDIQDPSNDRREVEEENREPVTKSSAAHKIALFDRLSFKY